MRWFICGLMVMAALTGCKGTPSGDGGGGKKAPDGGKKMMPDGGKKAMPDGGKKAMPEPPAIDPAKAKALLTKLEEGQTMYGAERAALDEKAMEADDPKVPLTAFIDKWSNWVAAVQPEVDGMKADAGVGAWAAKLTSLKGGLDKAKGSADLASMMAGIPKDWK